MASSKGVRVERVVVFLLWGVLAFDMLTAVSFAQTEASTGDYDQWVRQGIEEYDLGHYREAKAYFDRAHQVQPNARTLRGLGMVTYELRSYVAAADYFRKALASQARPLTDEMRIQVQRLLEQAESFVATGALEVTPPDATVTIDGQAPVYDDRGGLLLDPGAHELAVAASGHQGVTRKLVVGAGDALKISVELPSLTLKTGVEVRAPQVDIQTADPPWGTQRWVAFGFGAGGVLGLGMSGVLSLLAVSKNGDSDVNCARDLCNELGDKQRSQALTLGNVATASLIAGGALIGTALVLFFTESDSEAVQSEGNATRVTPMLGQQVGLILEGTL